MSRTVSFILLKLEALLRFRNSRFEISGEVIMGQVSGEVIIGQVSGEVIIGQVSGEVIIGQVSGEVIIGQVSGEVIIGQVSLPRSRFFLSVLFQKRPILLFILKLPSSKSKRNLINLNAMLLPMSGSKLKKVKILQNFWFPSQCG
jgi:hypothetical protein